MAFTYDITTDRGKVRIRIGDTTNLGDESLTDAEVDAALDISSDVDVAALVACRWLYAKRSAFISQSVKTVNTETSQRFAQTEKLLGMLEDRVGSDSPSVYFEGISEADNDVHDSDSDFAGTMFSIGQDDNPGGSTGGEDDVD